jgi:hypothetical protein
MKIKIQAPLDVVIDLKELRERALEVSAIEPDMDPAAFRIFAIRLIQSRVAEWAKNSHVAAPQDTIGVESVEMVEWPQTYTIEEL